MGRRRDDSEIVWMGVLTLLSLLTIGGRLVIEPRLQLPTATGSYEAIAHIYVGVLIGLWLAYRPQIMGKICLGHLTVITVVEVVMFIIQKVAS